MQEELPIPLPGELWAPLPWVKLTGLPVKYVKTALKAKCEDCLRCLLDHIQGKRPDRPAPGLARMADCKRTQGTKSQLLCSGHAQLHKLEEATRT